MKVLFSILCLLPGLTFGEYRYPVGERATYKIQWGPLSCGSSTIHCDEVVVDDARLIRVRIRVKSNWLVSKIYPVDDTVDCFIDPQTQLSVRLEKDTSEGDKICKDVLKIDRKTNWAEWISQSENMTTNYPIDAGACDAVSFIYDFRRYDFSAEESRDFKLVVDTAQHDITIQAKQTADKKMTDDGKVKCRKYLVTPKRDDLFVRKVPKAIWLTDDARKILVRMDVDVPVGSAKIILDEYIPPAEK